MDNVSTLNQLEELALKLGMTIRYEPLKIEGSLYVGGFCRIKGQDYVIVNKKATTQERIHVLADVLKRCDLGEIYVLPSLRKLLEQETAP
ncbi:MAG: hypothetical protein V1766_00235 [Pseudomonadota bacterium]